MVAHWPRGTAGPCGQGTGDCNDFPEPSKFHSLTGELGEDSRGCSGGTPEQIYLVREGETISLSDGHASLIQLSFSE